MANVRWGILGCGDVAEKKGGPALYQAQGSELVAVMRRDRAKAADFARRHGAKRFYDSAQALVEDPEVDAVYVATPPHLHREQTLLAARAGKHVLVEKPMALDGAACDAMIAACEAAGVHLHVAYYRRFYPKFVEARRSLQEGLIGHVVAARLQMCAMAGSGGWRTDPAISGGGQFVDVGSHRLDMLLHLMGDVAEVSGYAENLVGTHAAENDVALSLRMVSGVLVSAGFHFHTRPARDVLEIYGTEGTLTLDPFDGETLVCHCGGGSAPEAVTTRHVTPSPTHLPFVEALVAVYNGAEDLEHVTGVEGAKTTRIMDRVLAARR
jgi:predicted dehydrogenase